MTLTLNYKGQIVKLVYLKIDWTSDLKCGHIFWPNNRLRQVLHFHAKHVFSMVSWNANWSTPSTVILTSWNEISVEYIGEILWSRRNTIFLFKNYLVSAPIGIFISEKWLRCFETLLISNLCITYLSEVLIECSCNFTILFRRFTYIVL